MKPQVSEHGLDGVEIFHDLRRTSARALTAELDTLSLKRGDVLVRQGEMADALYIVVTGRFAVTLAGRPRADRRAGAGPAGRRDRLPCRRPRTATVTALRDSLVLRLGRAEFEALSAKSPSIWRTLTVTLAQPRRGGQRQPRAAARPAAAHGGADPRRRQRAAARLHRRADARVPAQQRTMLVRAEMAKAVLPANVRIDSAEATRALNALESRYDYVLFLADPELTPWSEKAIRQADLVLAVGMHAAGPSSPTRSSGWPPSCCRRRRSASCCCTRRAGPSPAPRAGSRIATSPCTTTLRSTTPADVERLYRFINGTALGLVACGGGAYCAAHIGLYKALTAVGPRLRHHGRHLRRRRHDGGLRHGRRTPTTSTAPRTTSSSPTRPCAATPGPATACSTTRTTTTSSPRHYSRRSTSRTCGSPTSPSRPTCRATTCTATAAATCGRPSAPAGSMPVLLPPYYTEDGQMLVDGAILDNVPIRTMHELKSGPNVVDQLRACRSCSASRSTTHRCRPAPRS